MMPLLPTGQPHLHLSFTLEGTVGSPCSSPLTVSPSYIKAFPNGPLWEPCLGLFTRMSSVGLVRVSQGTGVKNKTKVLPPTERGPLLLLCRLFGQSTFLAQLQRWKVSARRRPLVLESSEDTSPACPLGSHVPYHCACPGGGRFDLAILSSSLGRATQASAQGWRIESGRDSQPCGSETPSPVPPKAPRPGMPHLPGGGRRPLAASWYRVRSEVTRMAAPSLTPEPASGHLGLERPEPWSQATPRKPRPAGAWSGVASALFFAAREP